jgi:hypothetical protein
MMESYGVIVEGQFDVGVYEEFIRKICPEAHDIKARDAGGCAQLMKKFPSLLRSLEHVTQQGGPIDKALVIRDADCRDVAAIEAKMLILLARINETREFHRPDWDAVQATVAGGVLEFDFYFDYVIDQVSRLETLWVE